MKTKYALAVTITSAIKIGLKALGVKPGDEVITQASILSQLLKLL